MFFIIFLMELFSEKSVDLTYSGYYNIPRNDSPTNLFLSHSWGTDLRGRQTHDRVRQLKNELNKLGWKIWFDEDKLLVGCNIDIKMASGIRKSDAVCVCITRKYIEKINEQKNGDNCAKEWNFAQSLGKKIIPIIMEEEMLDVKAWPAGVMTMYLGNTFYIDCSGEDIKACAIKLNQMLSLLGLKQRLNQYKILRNKAKLRDVIYL